jgi:hypothetical protein
MVIHVAGDRRGSVADRALADMKGARAVDAMSGGQHHLPRDDDARTKPTPEIDQADGAIAAILPAVVDCRCWPGPQSQGERE